MTERYYVIDFVAQTGGIIRVKASSKKEALARANSCDQRVDDQICDQIDSTKACEMNIRLIRASVEIDSNQEPPSWSEEEE